MEFALSCLIESCDFEPGDITVMFD